MIAQSPGGDRKSVSARSVQEKIPEPIYPQPQAREELSPAALDEIRDLWGSGVPVGQLAGWWNVPVDSLLRQLFEHLKRRAADLQQQTEARQRGGGAANE